MISAIDNSFSSAACEQPNFEPHPEATMPQDVQNGHKERDQVRVYFSTLGSFMVYFIFFRVNPYTVKLEPKMSAVINRNITLHEGRVFKLVKEDYTLDNGVTSDMDFIQHPGAAAMVPMINSSEVILIKQYRHALREFIWEIPAGTLDPDESPLSCARRELIEETGYSAASWQQLGTITPLPGCSNERIHIFLASNLKTAEQNLDDDEMLKVHQLKLEDALHMIVKGEIADGKTISGLYLAYHWLQSN